MIDFFTEELLTNYVNLKANIAQNTLSFTTIQIFQSKRVLLQICRCGQGVYLVFLKLLIRKIGASV